MNISRLSFSSGLLSSWFSLNSFIFFKLKFTYRHVLLKFIYNELRIIHFETYISKLETKTTTLKKIFFLKSLHQKMKYQFQCVIHRSIVATCITQMKRFAIICMVNYWSTYHICLIRFFETSKIFSFCTCTASIAIFITILVK